MQMDTSVHKLTASFKNPLPGALTAVLNTLLKDATSYYPTHLLRNLHDVLDCIKRILAALVKRSNLFHFGRL